MYVERDVAEIEGGPDYYRGLGVDPLTIATVGKGVYETGFLQDIFGFGGPNDCELPGWPEGALAGSSPCSSATLKTYGKPPPPNEAPYWEGEWTEGTAVGPFDREELRRALEAAPPGRPGDDPGTVEGLVTAVQYAASSCGGGVSIRRPRDMRELANAAAFIALGRSDCVVGWHEAPTLVHTQNILDRYRRGEYGSAPTMGGAGPAAGEWGGADVAAPLESLGDIGRGYPLATAGVMLALVLGAGYLVKGR